MILMDSQGVNAVASRFKALWNSLTAAETHLHFLWQQSDMRTSVCARDNCVSGLVQRTRSPPAPR